MPAASLSSVVLRLWPFFSPGLPRLRADALDDLTGMWLALTDPDAFVSFEAGEGEDNALEYTACSFRSGEY